MTALSGLAREATKTTAANQLRDILYSWWADGGPFSQQGRTDFYSRPIICTPFGGNYGQPAGWVIVVEGSPSRGTLFLDGGHAMTVVPYCIAQRKRRIFGEPLEIVRRFHEVWLENTESIIHICYQPVATEEPVRVCYDDDADQWHW